MPVSLWLDGCFDGFHYAHANAIRQALYLVENSERPRIFCGVHSDKEILKNKGPTLFDETERYALIRGCRWVDEVVEDVPYVTRFDVTRGHSIDFVVHGDDTVLDAEGNDCYGAFKAAGKYLECKRTDGISTTSLIQRLLRPEMWKLAGSDGARLEGLVELFIAAVPYPFFIFRFDDVTASERRWPADRKIVYIGDSWDCFGAGHVELLRRAKTASNGDVFLVVGIWSDESVREATGDKPLLAQLERALAIIQCKYADAVVLSPPVEMSPKRAQPLRIDVIVSAGDKDMTLSKQNSIVCIQVERPELQTIGMLREKLEAQRELYEERQRRKGAV